MRTRASLLLGLLLLGLLLGLGLGAGCHAPAAPYDDLRQACGLEDGQFVASTDDGEPIHPITEECADRLGAAIGMEWDTFGAVPHGFEVAGTTDERVIGGVFTLLASDQGTIGEWEPDPQLGEDDAVGEVWWDTFTGRIDRIKFSEREEEAARYRPFKTIVFGDLTDASVHPDWPNTVVWVAGLLLHEAAHNGGNFHGRCEVGAAEGYFCDPDPSGAIGVEASWLSDWLDNDRDNRSGSQCEDVVRELRWVCGLIEEPSNFDPCGPSELCWDGVFR